MVQVADGGAKTAPAKAAAGGAGAPPANAKAWNSAQQSNKPAGPPLPSPVPHPPSPQPPPPRATSTPAQPSPHPAPGPAPQAGPPAQPAPTAQAQPHGGLHARGGAGIGTGTATPVPNVPAVPGTATAPYDPSPELNRLKSDGDVATFAVSAGGGAAVVTPWTGPVNVGPQASAGYIATVKQVGGGGPGQPATTVPPKYTVTLDKNQSAGVYGTVNVSAMGAKADAIGWLELDAKHADRVTMTFDTKDEAAHAVRIMQREAEAQTLRDVKQVVTPSITVPDPVAAAKGLAGRAVRDPLGTAADVLNPINQVKTAIDVGGTIASGVVQDVKSFFNNPLTGNNGSNAPPPGTIEIPVGNPVSTIAGQALDAAAARVEPSAADKAFMQSHVSSYETAITGQERLTLEAKLGSWVSVDGRVAATQTLTRTVTLPAPAASGQPAKPGTVAYEYKGGAIADTRTRAKLGAQLEKLLTAKGVKMPQVKGLPVSIGGGLNTVVQLGQVSQAARVTFNMTPAQSAAVQQSRGEAIPGITDMGKPAAVDVTFQGRAALPPDAVLPGIGSPPGELRYFNWKTTGAVADPGGTLNSAKDQLLNGDVSKTLETLARHTSLNSEVTLTRQEGGNVNAIASFGLKDGPLQVAEVWGIASATAQTDTVIARAQGRVAWEDPPVQTQPTPTPTPVPTPTPTPVPPQPYQVAVVPHDGLNIRAHPGTDAKVLGPAYSGTFLQATGRTQTDAQGQEWLEVHGPDMFRHEQKGWVSSEYVERHSEGAMAPESGRINELREQGYVAIPVKPGDTISGIALKNGVDPSKAVTVNNGHVIDVNLIFPGDTVYIPGR